MRPLIHEARRWIAACAGYGAVMAVAVTVTATSIDRLATTWLQPQPAARTATMPPAATTTLPPAAHATITPAPLVVVRQASMIQTNDEWAEKLRDPAFWNKMKTGKSGKGQPEAKSKPEPKWGLGGPTPQPASSSPTSSSSKSTWKWDTSSDNEDETYRTVCVRLCDGSFFPISFSTTRENFDADAAKCEKTCAGGRLFYHRNPGSEIDDLEDVNGKPYKKLTTAFLFRTTYVEQCKCRAHPWEEASRDQHRIYALEEQRAKGNKTVASELNILNAKVKQAEAEAAADKKRAEAAEKKKQADAAAAAKAAKSTKTTSIKANSASGQAQASTSEPNAARGQPPQGLMSLGVNEALEQGKAKKRSR